MRGLNAIVVLGGRRAWGRGVRRTKSRRERLAKLQRALLGLLTTAGLQGLLEKRMRAMPSIDAYQCRNQNLVLANAMTLPDEKLISLFETSVCRLPFLGRSFH